MEAAVRGAGGVTVARARLHAALLALQSSIPSQQLKIPNRGPSLPYCGPGVRPGDVTMMPKTTDMSLLVSVLYFLRISCQVAMFDGCLRLIFFRGGRLIHYLILPQNGSGVGLADTPLV